MPNPANLVHQTATSTGTGNFTLAKVNGKRDFATAFSTGGANVFDYFISNQGAAEWERGTGSCPTTATMSRDTVYETHLGTTAKIDFTAGTKDVVNDIPALNQVIGSTVASSGHAAIFDTTLGNVIKSAGYVPQAQLTAGTGISFSGSTINAVTATTTQTGTSILSDAARLRANTTGYVVNVDSIWAGAGSVALSTATTAVAVDMSTFLTLATLEMSTHHTLSNPTSPKVGQHFIIRAITTGSSALTLSLGTAYKLLTGIETGPYTIVASGAEKIYIAGFVETSTGIIVSAVGRTTAVI